MQYEEMWQYICKHFDKRIDEQRTVHYMQRSQDHSWSLEVAQSLIMVSGNSHNLAPVLMLTERKNYPGSWYALKLGSEKMSLDKNTSIDDIRPFLIRKKFGDY